VECDREPAVTEKKLLMTSSGVQTPVAGIVHAMTLLTILLVAAPLAKFIPLAILAAVLFVVAYREPAA
jgi:MFS superfamily sulfate permease-like transporter